ncbi:ferric uptake regulator, Fur family [Rippkaea orientalis PCC 8801]|uniref:Ferric uptake regulator, Fur family n=1 Tax=Rippkaea orientalis (strain PCC 8801 / RF-1) TaxID=41431 RepID=B7K613_RIPO1|nr:Fur family transcriptional regulator [Rippkaea orientalis]ACK68066.1 ferric uptake regulator, Fur family [Rippkaea orientalis PCC 8801]
MKGQRTRSQERIVRLLKSLNHAVSAQDLYLELKTRDQALGLATVYRSLEALKLEGTVQARTLTNGEAVYSLVAKDQHHLTCVNCGQSFPIDECPVHDLEQRLEKSHRFQVYYHTLEFFGLCYDCQLSAERNR